MEQIAVIRIFMQNDANADISRSQRKKEHEWEVVLNPIADKKRVPKIGGETPTILAHELGHVVSAIMGEQPPHNIIDRMGYVSPQLMGEERRAWTYAEVIEPTLNKSVEQYALKAYESAQLK